jgi:hypothetical protein
MLLLKFLTDFSISLDAPDERKRNIFCEETNDFQAEGGGRVKRRLSLMMGAGGRSSDISILKCTQRGSRIWLVGGGCSTKKPLAMTLAVMWEGAEGTQEDSSLPSIRGKRFARTTTREIAQTHAATR